jgi:hypothetical protein
LGFGRSGTTWISELISKISGSLILFEPLHPCAAEFSRDISYGTVVHPQDSLLLETPLKAVMDKQKREKWLLRGHIPMSLDDAPESLVDLLWRECPVLGFKEIRANLMIDWLHSEFGARIVYIVRDPCAVIASIKARVNFWGEFGWPEHYQMFLDRTVYNSVYEDHSIQSAIDTIEKASTDIEKQAVMWAVTHAIALPELRRLGLPVFQYEDFSTDPFDTVRNLVNYLGLGDKGIHPSFIFTSSKTSAKSGQTLFEEKQQIRKNASTWLAGSLTRSEIDSILRVIGAFQIGIDDDQKSVGYRPPTIASTA